MWRLDWLGLTVSLVKFPTSVGMVPVRTLFAPVASQLMDSSQMPAAVA